MQLRYLFTDVRGFLMQVVRQEHVQSLQNRVPVSGALVPGWQSNAESDLQLIADETTYITDPIDARRLVFSQPVQPGGERGSYPMDVRGVAHRAQDLLRTLRIADDIQVGTELEFNLFKGVRFATTAELNLVEIAEEDGWACNAAALGNGYRIGQRHHQSHGQQLQATEPLLFADAPAGVGLPQQNHGHTHTAFHK